MRTESGGYPQGRLSSTLRQIERLVSRQSATLEGGERRSGQRHRLRDQVS